MRNFAEKKGAADAMPSTIFWLLGFLLILVMGYLIVNRGMNNSVMPLVEAGKECSDTVASCTWEAISRFIG